MKAINQVSEFKIHYVMTIEEADLIERMCDGYTSLARELVKISTKFTEDEKTLQGMLFKLGQGIGEELKLAKQAKAVHEGKMVAITPERLEYLLIQEAENKADKKRNRQHD